MIRETWKVPELTDCNPGIEPFEFQVLVAMAEKPAVTAGGLHLPQSVKDREEWGADHARLIALSPLAFTYADWPEGVRKPQVGDVVFLGKYPGDEVTGRDGRKYRVCSDREIKAVIERAPSPQEIAEAKVAAEFAHITQPLEAAVERLFGVVGGDIKHYRTPDNNEVVAFANGALNPEGFPAAVLDEGAVIEMTLAAIREHFPDHSNQKLYWRRRPTANVYPAETAEETERWLTPSERATWDGQGRSERVLISLRIGADNILEAQNAA